MNEFNKAIELEPAYQPVYISRAKLHRDNGDIENALADLHYALELSPDNIQAREILAELYKNLEDFEKEEIYYRYRLQQDNTIVPLKDLVDPVDLQNDRHLCEPCRNTIWRTLK